MLLVVVCAPLTSCLSAPSTVCVPTLTVDPDNPRPGRIVTVSTTDACPLPAGAEQPGAILESDVRGADDRAQAFAIGLRQG